MKFRFIWLSWLYMYILCAAVSFIPEPAGFFKVLFVLLALGFFVPGMILLVKADHRDDCKTIRLIRLISICALVASTLMIILNILSATMSKAWGDVLYVMLILFANPMICGQYWVIGLFGWAFLLFYAISLLKKQR